jgi:hypothetical protein
MKRISVPLLAVVAVLGSSFVPGANEAAADAKSHRGQSRELRRYPADFENIPGTSKEDALKLALQSSSDPLTIVFSKGKYEFDQLFIFKRSNVRICGATGNPRDVTLSFTGTGVGRGAGAGFYIQQASKIEIRDMTVKSSFPGGSAVVMDALLNETLASFAESLTLDRCHLEADFPVITTALTRNLTVNKCKITVTATDAFGLVFGGDQGLFVSGTEFKTADGVDAFTGVFVVGVGAQSSEGVLVSTVILNRNRVKGSFARAFDLADVRDVRMRKNRIKLSGDPIRPATPRSGNLATGRVGILIRRDEAADLPRDIRVLNNRVRGAFYGVWLSFLSFNTCSGNDLRKCGSDVQDEFFLEFGGAVRVQLVSGVCRADIADNDMRDLRSPKSAFDGQSISDIPAVVVVPSELAGACFADGGDNGNRLSSGRALFVDPQAGKGVEQR